MTSMGVYGVILAGWASNSKYAFLGCLRSAAQIVSYEIAMGFALVGVLMAASSLNISDIVRGQQGGCRTGTLPLFPLFVVYLVSGIAETNRHPFDVAEGESEIVAGFHVEYSGMAFAVFFLAEYMNMILISALAVDHVPRRMAVAVARCAFTDGFLASSGCCSRCAACCSFSLDPRDLPALPLRPDHAPGLEGVHSRSRWSGSCFIGAMMQTRWALSVSLGSLRLHGQQRQL